MFEIDCLKVPIKVWYGRHEIHKNHWLNRTYIIVMYAFIVGAKLVILVNFFWQVIL